MNAIDAPTLWQGIALGAALGIVVVTAFASGMVAYAVARGQQTVDDIFDQEWSPW